MPNSSIQSILHLSIHLSYLEESFCLDTIYSAELPKSCGFFERRRQDVDRAQRKQILNKYSGVFLFIYASVKRHKYVKFKTGTTNIN